MPTKCIHSAGRQFGVMLAAQAIVAQAIVAQAIVAQAIVAQAIVAPAIVAPAILALATSLAFADGSPLLADAPRSSGSASVAQRGASATQDGRTPAGQDTTPRADAAQTAAPPKPPALWIGYSQHQTNLPGGRHANTSTSRALLIQADGTSPRPLAPELADQLDAWTQFAGWSPDGKTAIVGRGWESRENAQWEDEHGAFRFTPEGWLYDAYLVDVASGKAENVTGVDRVSFYNSGLFYWPNDPQKLGFLAIIDGNSHPFSMHRDGSDKVDLTKDSGGFAYGFSASRDGKRIAYHENYQIYLADPDGTHRVHIDTKQPFNFVPEWSPDGQWVLFVSGEHYDCHPHLVKADGTGLRKLADRQGYRGVVEILDVPDHHGGSSDVPVWSTDGQTVYYTALAGENVELFCVAIDGESEQLTHSPRGTLHYHPRPSPDGQWLAYGSKREGARNLYIMRLSDRPERPLTSVPAGRAAMHPHWQPLP